MRQREVPLLHTAVEPLQHPAFGAQGKGGEQRLHKKGRAVVGEFPGVGPALRPIQGKIRMRPRAAHDRQTAGDGSAHDEVLQAEQRAGIESIQRKQRKQQHRPEQIDGAAQKFSGHGQAERVVHGPHDARSPQEKTVYGRQGRVPRRHAGQKQIARLRHKQQAPAAQRDQQDKTTDPSIKRHKPEFLLTARKRVVKAGGRPHVQKARELGENAGGEIEVAIRLRPERAGQYGLHDQIHGNRRDVGGQLAHVAARKRRRSRRGRGRGGRRGVGHGRKG